MTTDSIRIIPAGHKTPPLQRLVVSDNGGLVWQIEKAHEKWQAKNPDKSEWSAAYQSAQYHTKGIRGLDLEQTSIDAFIIAHVDDSAFLNSGLFLSALYNKLRNPHIIYNHQTPINKLAYKLNQKKTFEVNGTAGNYCGWDASGVVVINGAAGNDCGWEASGVVVEMKQNAVASWSRWKDKNGIFIPYATLQTRLKLKNYLTNI